MRALAQPHRPRGRPAVRAFYGLPARSLSLRRRVYVALGLAYMLDSLVRVSRRAARIRFTNGATERGRKPWVSTRRSPSPISRTRDRPEPARPPTPPPPLQGHSAVFREGTSATDRSSVRFRPRRERRRQKTSTPARSAGPIPRWHAIGRDASPVDSSPPVLARYDSDRSDDWKPTFEGNSRPQSIDSYASPNNDFKFF